jgi:hypothetical protein
MAKKYTNIFHSKALQNIPTLGFLVRKYIYHLATLPTTTWPPLVALCQYYDNHFWQFSPTLLLKTTVMCIHMYLCLKRSNLGQSCQFFFTFLVKLFSRSFQGRMLWFLKYFENIGFFLTLVPFFQKIDYI